MNTSSPKILITGGQGQLAQALLKHPSADSYSLLALARQALDITQMSAITQAIQQHQPDFIINTAAYTAVDKAEQETILADSVNHQGAQQLAIACQKNHIPLLHISTDYVFDGTQSTPYAEEALANPLNHYGLTKWQGEQAVREHCEQHVILRVSGIFSADGNNFLKTMVKLARERTLLRVVNDQITCPTPANDIAGALLQMISRFSKVGTYHYCGNPAVSWYEFTRAIVEQAKSHMTLAVQDIQPISTAEFNAAAKRPLYSVLNCSKIAKDYGIQQSNWELGLAEVFARSLRG